MSRPPEPVSMWLARMAGLVLVQKPTALQALDVIERAIGPLVGRRVPLGGDEDLELQRALGQIGILRGQIRNAPVLAPPKPGDGT
jgi:hypothetical protein